VKDPTLLSTLVIMYKGIWKLIKGKFWPELFQKKIFNRTFLSIFGMVAGFLRFRRFFRHPYQPFSFCHPPSVVHVICQNWQMTDIDDIWQMTDNVSDNVNMSVYGIVWTPTIQPPVPNFMSSFSVNLFENTTISTFPLRIFGFLCIFWPM
jgi:hypothetical protein